MYVSILSPDADALAAVPYAAQYVDAFCENGPNAVGLVCPRFQPRRLARQAPNLTWVAFVEPDEYDPPQFALYIYEGVTGRHGKPRIHEMRHVNLEPVIRVSARASDEAAYVAYRQVVDSLTAEQA